MMSEISYHQQQYIRHQKREKKLVLFLRIFILLLFLVLWEISARTGLIDSFIFTASAVCAETALFFPISLLQLRKHWSVFCSLLFWVQGWQFCCGPVPDLRRSQSLIS